MDDWKFLAVFGTGWFDAGHAELDGYEADCFQGFDGVAVLG